jgi:hypothetical protein
MSKTVEQWSRVLAVSLTDAQRILAYLRLENIGTIHGDPLTGDSLITVISRRMIRDEKLRKMRQECGKKGGNPVLKKQSDKDTLAVLDNQISTTQVNHAANQPATKSQPLHLQSSSSIIKNYRPRPRPRSDVFPEDSYPFRLSKFLWTFIQGNFPKTRAPDLQKWARHVDLMLRADKRPHEDIGRVIEWCQKNDFWKANILSTEKLRKQFDTIQAQMGGLK